MFDNELDNLTWHFFYKGHMTMLAVGNSPLPTLGPLRLVTSKFSSKTGCMNLINQDGTVMSVQPDGSVQTRPSGTDGQYEQGMINGAWIVYCPDSVHVYAFPLFQQVPA